MQPPQPSPFDRITSIRELALDAWTAYLNLHGPTPPLELELQVRHIELLALIAQQLTRIASHPFRSICPCLDHSGPNLFCPACHGSGSISQ